MANAFTGSMLTNSIKKLVSKRKNRYTKDGFDLDLTYITGEIIAMGYPASNVEGIYRNHIDEVVRFLETKHKEHYFIYNLCSERSYDKSRFQNRVKIFPFDDHNPPIIELIHPFCKDVHRWLTSHPDNVAAVHCKAGKGRTGTMICCYLLYSKMHDNADSALNYYGQKRTQNRRGVTIPSQVRYVKYYEEILRDNLVYKPVEAYIKEFHLVPQPNFAGGQGSVYFRIWQQTLNHFEDQPIQKCIELIKTDTYDLKKGETSLVAVLDTCVPLSGDIKVEFYNKAKLGRNKFQFQFWFNTFFVCKSACCADSLCNGSKCDSSYTACFKKNELDLTKANKKDKENKIFSADFQLRVVLKKVPSNLSCHNQKPLPLPPTSTTPGPPGPPQTPSSDSSEVDSSDEDDWDSGECASSAPL